mgnify:CR=1 FL=1
MAESVHRGAVGMAMTISVLLVEDDPEMRTVLAQHVAAAPQLRLLAALGDVATGLEALRDARPDVLLVDLDLPDGSGIELIRAGLAATPPVDAMVITVFGDERHVLEAVEAGAAGYLLKDSDARAVAEAVAAVHRGESPISPAIARHLLRRLRPHTTEPRTSPLSERETEVLSLVARGYTNAEIAELLAISFHTVAAHVKHIYAKLAVGSRSAAVYEARSLGFLDPHG